MKKPMYAPLKKSYDDDMNDLIEDEMFKGGAGSGKRGHKTATDPRTEYASMRDFNLERRKKKAIEGQQLDKMRGLSRMYKDKHQQAKDAGHHDVAKEYKNHHNDLQNGIMQRLGAGTKDMKKGGPGSGKRGHKTINDFSGQESPENKTKRVAQDEKEFWQRENTGIKQKISELETAAYHSRSGVEQNKMNQKIKRLRQELNSNIKRNGNN